MVVTADQTIEVAAHPVPQVVDSTGAGDLYAAGFLYGWSQDMALADCGRLGSMAAAAVIGHTGARPGLSLDQLSAASEQGPPVDRWLRAAVGGAGHCCCILGSCVGSWYMRGQRRPMASGRSS